MVANVAMTERGNSWNNGRIPLLRYNIMLENAHANHGSRYGNDRKGKLMERYSIDLDRSQRFLKGKICATSLMLMSLHSVDFVDP